MPTDAWTEKDSEKDRSGGVDLGILLNEPAGVMTASECASQRKEEVHKGRQIRFILAKVGFYISETKPTGIKAQIISFLFTEKGPLIFLMMQPASWHITVKNMSQFGKCGKILKRK